MLGEPVDPNVIAPETEEVLHVDSNTATIAQIQFALQTESGQKRKPNHEDIAVDGWALTMLRKDAVSACVV